MKKKLMSLLLALAMVFSLAACGDDLEETPETPADRQTVEPSSGGSGSATPAARGLSMRVDSATGELSIMRANLAAGTPEADGVWTILVYLCGTDLESFDEAGTGDLAEMRAASTGDKMRFIVQTGGTLQWYDDNVSSEKLQRFIIQNGNIEQVDEQPLADMGSGETLTAFLNWAMENYASEHMGLIFWNHGGGCITGVCFDELNDYHSLDLKEVDAALFACCSAAGRRFDFIGFDACLMGTMETANILATYADYMIGSEETEPGSGWNYTAIGNYLGSNPGADAVSLGKVVCDSFYEDCRAQQDDDLTTLAVIDLSRIDNVLSTFNSFAHSMFDAASDEANCAAMVRGIGKADNFGGNNKSEGYTNMVDMGGLITACRSYAQGADEALAAIQNAVVYSVSGSAHKDASGLSLYYPLSVQGSQELSIFGAICTSPYYLAFVDRQNQGGAVGVSGSYDGAQWFNTTGEWSWGGEDTSHWDYLDEYEQTGESPYITFASAPQLDADGSFWFELDDEGYNAAADVYGIVYEISADGEDIIKLGQTYDLNADWETGAFADDFDGWWISLPDGQNLATYIVESTADYTIYTSPIQLNGKDTNLRLKLDYDAGTMTIEGAWDGVNEYGAASRDIIKLKSGDTIVPTYTAYALESDDEYTYFGQEYVITGEPEICYGIMEDGDYLYAFNIDDIYGDYYLSDFVSFTVEDGEVWFAAE